MKKLDKKNIDKNNTKDRSSQAYSKIPEFFAKKGDYRIYIDPECTMEYLGD